MQNLFYAFMILMGIIVGLMPWFVWDRLKEQSWKAKLLTKWFGEKAARFVYSVIGLIIIVLASLAMLGKLQSH